MKDYSCAQIKRGRKAAIQQLPREGTLTRELFDLFMTYKGQIIDLGNWQKNIDMRVYYLQNFYGLDIAHKGKGKWSLIGEYIGAKYVSYYNERPLNVKIKGKIDV